MPRMNTRPPPVGPRSVAVRVPCTAPSGAGPVDPAGSDHATACSCELETVPGPAGPIPVLRVAGEIDLLTLPLLEHSLTAAVDQRPAHLVVDLAAVGFCCIRGFGLLATTAATAQSRGTRFALSGLPPHLNRFAALLWLEQPCVLYRSVAAAVTAIRIDQAHRPT